MMILVERKCWGIDLQSWIYFLALHLVLQLQLPNFCTIPSVYYRDVTLKYQQIM